MVPEDLHPNQLVLKHRAKRIAQSYEDFEAHFSARFTAQQVLVMLQALEEASPGSSSRFGLAEIREIARWRCEWDATEDLLESWDKAENSHPKGLPMDGRSRKRRLEAFRKHALALKAAAEDLSPLELSYLDPALDDCKRADLHPAAHTASSRLWLALGLLSDLEIAAEAAAPTLTGRKPNARYGLNRFLGRLRQQFHALTGQAPRITISGIDSTLVATPLVRFMRAAASDSSDLTDAVLERFLKAPEDAPTQIEALPPAFGGGPTKEENQLRS